MSRGFNKLKTGTSANWPAARINLPGWFDNGEESSSFAQVVQVQKVLPAYKNQVPSAENVNETHACERRVWSDSYFDSDRGCDMK